MMFVIGDFSKEKRDRHPLAIGLASKNPPPRGQALGALRASKLLDRFYSWRGASGERYVCSIFSLEEETIVADFSQAIAIGVARDGARRRPVCLLPCRAFETDPGRAIRDAARAHGVNEWHVHFGSGDAGSRDLAESLLN
jgi:hypothetical protein